MMKVFVSMSLVGAALLAMLVMGCAVSASFSSDGRAVLNGQQAVVVKASQPEGPAVAPPPPAAPTSPIRLAAPVKLKAKLVGNKIEITEKVMFDYNKATIKVESHSLLADVAKVISEHKQISKIRVEGHTDSDGEDAYNKKLSQQRADAVKSFLVKAGIGRKLLEAVGYGEEKPIGSNDTEEGKEKNRRVEFVVVQNTDKAK
ncbi:MAG: OmpA family protein [Myxococcota bacterium]|nr:OmpA family protein [Myxococcota bacterium]